MSNSLSNRSPEHAAALDITLAIIANSNPLTSSGPKNSAEYGERAASYANAIFNKVLENLQKDDK